jgi:hypothetical protein
MSDMASPPLESIDRLIERPKYALMKPLVIVENVMLGVIVLQDKSQSCNCIGGRPRVLLRTERSRWEKWRRKQGIG